jgi:hypothetical protein
VSCETILNALSDFAKCEETPDGYRILTHCLYPSFTPVPIYVVKFGDGFIIHDNGEAKATAWEHGRDSAIATRYLNEQALRYGLKLEDGRLSLTVQTADWLASAIVAVANGAATAAGQAVEHVARSAMLVLQDEIQKVLVGRFAASRVTAKPTRAGASGRSYEFDFAVSDAGHTVLIDAVTPYANSINSKYTAFSDVGSMLEKRGLVVFDKPLEPSDKTLLSEVADVVPLKALTERITNDLPSLAI